MSLHGFKSHQTFLCHLFSLSNANILLVLGELMSQNGNNNEDDDGNENEDANRAAIPLIGAGILIAQLFMSIATRIGDYYTERGVGRKVLFLVGLVTLPIRCILIIYWKDAGNTFLLLTQVLDGISGGFFGLLHPYLVADITFGSGRFNLISAYTFTIVFISCFRVHPKKHIVHILSESNCFVSSNSGFDRFMFWAWRNNQ